MSDRLAWAIATCVGVGGLPVAPGTAASLIAAVAVLAVGPSALWIAAAAVAVTVVGTWAAGREEQRLGRHDPSSIVIDEVAGMLVALVGQPQGLGWVLGLTLAFRVLDVWKPFPIRQTQRLPGGFGIVADDLVAGLGANLIGQLRHLII